MKKILMGVMVLFFAQNSFADWIYDEVVGFSVHTDGGLSVAVQNSHGCGSTILGVNNPEGVNINRIISVLLAYQAQNKPLRFAVQGCSGNVAIFDRIQTY